MPLQHDSRITPCLWFDDQGEAAAAFYVSIFPHSRITDIARFGETGKDVHGRPPGSVMTVRFELDGQPFTALNGGPRFHFSEAISLQIACRTQDEVDHYWDRLSAGGDSTAQQCGWLKDRFGLSWQVVPRRFGEWVAHATPESAERGMTALLKMKKLDIAELEKAYAP